MSTWAELRQEILFMLGENPDATTASDIRNTVDIKLKRKRDEIYGLKPPKSLLVYSSSVSVPSTLEYIKIESSGSGDNPGWNITDFWRTFSLVIALDTETDINEAEDWEPTEWDAWVRQNSATQGKQRLATTFTQDYRNYIYLNTLPGTGVTWKAWLHYFKQPATISDGGTPEIGQEHESLIVLAVCLDFPNLFRGDERASIYAAMTRQYKERLADYLRAMTVKKRATRLRPFVKRNASPGVFWGTGETS